MPRQNNKSGWTVETVLVYCRRLCSEASKRNQIRVLNLRAMVKELDKRVEQRFLAVDKATAFAFMASEQARIKAETTTEKRFDSVNEFRAQLSDQASTFITKSEVELKLEATNNRYELYATANAGRITKLEQNWSEGLGRQSQSMSTADNLKWFIGLGISIILGAVSLGIAILKH